MKCCKKIVFAIGLSITLPLGGQQHESYQTDFTAAVEKALSFRGHLSHPVGMTVHDVGNYKRVPLVSGIVFSIDPMLWVPEEKLYIRMEDVVAVTKDGVENFTDFLPARLDDIERLIQEEGIVQLHPSEE